MEHRVQDARSIDSFLTKVKKQAKRLLKLSKEQQFNLNITNLAQAQDVLAQLNGYSDWHGFETFISNQRVADAGNASILKVINSQLKFETLKDITYLNKDSDVLSFFEICEIPIPAEKSISKFFQHILNTLAFRWNMEFHTIKLSLSFGTEEYDIKSKTLPYLNYSNKLSLSKKELDDLFSISLPEHRKSFKLKVLIMVKTDNNLLDEHIDFCKDLISLKSTFKLRTTILESELQCFTPVVHEDSTYFTVYESNNLSLHEIMGKDNSVSNNWVHGIYAIYKKQIPSNMIVNIEHTNTNFSFIMKKEVLDKYNTYLQGLWRSLNKNAYDDYHLVDNIILDNDRSYTELPFKEGIPFLNKTDGYSSNFKLLNNKQNTHNTIICSNNIEDSSYLTNILGLDWILNNENTKLSVINTNTYKNTLYPCLKNIFNDKYINKQTLGLDTFINPFATELGMRHPNAAQHMYLVNLVAILMSNQNDDVPSSILSLIREQISIVYKQLSDNECPNLYEVGVLPTIDYVLASLNISTNATTTWWYIVDILFEHNRLNEAKLAQTYAVPKLTNMVFLKHEVVEKYKDISIDNTKLVNYYHERLMAAIKKYPQLNTNVDLIVPDSELLFIDLDTRSSDSKNEHTNSILYMLGRYIANRHNGLFNLDLNYNDNTPLLYNTYYTKLKTSLNNSYSMTICNDIDLVSDSYFFILQTIDDIRNARKSNTCLLLNTSILTDCNKELAALCSNRFIFNIEQSNVKKISEVFNMDKKLLIQHVFTSRQATDLDFFTLIYTNEGNFQKTLSFKLTPKLKYLFSYNIKDIELRDSLSNKLGYINAISELLKLYPD